MLSIPSQGRTLCDSCTSVPHSDLHACALQDLQGHLWRFISVSSTAVSHSLVDTQGFNLSRQQRTEHHSDSQPKWHALIFAAVARGDREIHVLSVKWHALVCLSLPRSSDEYGAIVMNKTLHDVMYMTYVCSPSDIM
jgi:hypothetical protein